MQSIGAEACIGQECKHMEVREKACKHSRKRPLLWAAESIVRSGMER
jgi:hypothetical protein